MNEDINIERKKMNDGNEIPALGLGTYRTGIGRQTREAVEHALSIGYRHIDTASVYGNEKDVGEAVRVSGIHREDIFVATKLWNTDQGYDSTKRALKRSLSALGLDYVDLYLIHWPVYSSWMESWKAMEEMKKEGLARSIGVSNFNIRHLDELISTADIKPAVDQVEFSPFLYQKDLLDYCVNKDILLEGYSPLTKGKKLNDPTIVRVSRELGMTPAQVMIRWALAHDVISIPKSSKNERIEENLKTLQFGIDDDNMRILDNLDEGLRTGWDPTSEP